MKPPRRIVLDTNVVISALVFRGGSAAQVRRAWQAGLFTPLVSTVTVSELMRVLAYPKFKLEHHEKEELLADYLPHALAVRVPNPPATVPPCRDSFDVPFLQLAVAGKADALVSGDRDVLTLAPHANLRVLSLDSFAADLKLNY